MNIITTNPIIERNDYNRNDWYTGADGTMDVITSDPIIDGNYDTFEDEFISNKSDFGGGAANRRARRAGRRKKRGGRKAAGTDLGSKLKGGLGMLADSGILDTLVNGRANGDNLRPPVLVDNSSDLGLNSGNDEDEGMSTGVKVIIGVGIAAVLGLGAYYLLKGKKGKKS